MDISRPPSSFSTAFTFVGSGPYLSSEFRSVASIKTNRFKWNDDDLTSKPANDVLPMWEKWFLFFVRMATSFHSLPITFNQSTGIIHLTHCNFTLPIWYWRLVCLSIDNIYLLIVSKKIQLKLVGDKEFVNFWIHAISRNIAGIIMWAMAMDLQGTVQIYNTMVLTNNTWKRRFGNWGSTFSGPLEKGLGRTLQIAAIFLTFQAFSPLALHLDCRHSARYWGSQFLPKTVWNSIPGIILLAAYDFSLSLYVAHGTGYVILITVAYFVVMRFWTTSVTENMVRTKVLTCSTPLKQYRCLLCLGRIANCCMGTAIFPSLVFLAAFILCIMFSLFVKKRDVLILPLMLNMGVASLLFLRALEFVLGGGGLMLARSQDLKRLFKLERGLYRRKYVVSLRDMRIYVGQFYFVSQSSFVTCLRWILDQTITIIFAM